MAKSDEPNRVIYSMVGVGKVHGTKQVLKDIYLGYFYGAKIGVIGLNGSGKSTLLRIMAGVEKEFIGEVAASPGYTVGFLEQEPKLDPGKTVLDVVRESASRAPWTCSRSSRRSPTSSPSRWRPTRWTGSSPARARCRSQLDAADAWDLDSRLELAMDALRCPPGDTPIKVLSGGELRRVALCRLLLAKPDILLLDEPTNHLDAETVAWLEQHLQKYEGTVIAVTHDRYFLDNVAGWILELDRGAGIPWKGNYSSWLQQKQEKLRQEQKQESERQKTLARELEWIHMAPKARRAKGKARINAYQQLLTARQDEVARDLEIYIPPGERLGDLVIEAKGLSKGFGDKLLMENVEFALPPGAIVGVIGPNGAGKTTLARMIVGQETPDAGTLRKGETVQVAYVDQSRTLDPEKTVFEVISEGLDEVTLGKVKMSSRAYCSRFNLSGADQQKKVSQLSGGERNRVHLARMLKEGANVLLLDEPTNDLDVNTLRALEDAIEQFAGCAIVISHDRWFLDRVATHILAFEGESKVTFFDGNFSEYEEWRKQQLGDAATRPHRITYRRLTR